jgi:hypothetical protein
MKIKMFIFLLIFSTFIFLGGSNFVKADTDPCLGQDDNTSCYVGGIMGICQSGTCTQTGSESIYQGIGGTGSTSETTTTAKCGSGYTETNGVCFPSQTNLPSSDVKTIVTNILYWMLGIFGVIAIIAFAISGFQYLMSAGNESMIETAKRNMVWSIVGVVVALSGLVIIYAIDAALRGDSVF